MAAPLSTTLLLIIKSASATNSKTKTKNYSSVTNRKPRSLKTLRVRVCSNLSTSRQKSRQSLIYGLGKIRSNWKSRLMRYLRMVKFTWSARLILVSGWISRRSSTSWSLSKDLSLVSPARTKSGQSRVAKTACPANNKAVLPTSRSHTRLLLSKGLLRKTL